MREFYHLCIPTIIVLVRLPHICFGSSPLPRSIIFRCLWHQVEMFGFIRRWGILWLNHSSKSLLWWAAFSEKQKYCLCWDITLFSRRDDGPRRSNRIEEEKRLEKNRLRSFVWQSIGLSTAHKAPSTTLNREEQRRTQLQIFDRPSSLLIGACFSGLSIGLRRLSTIRGPKTWICFLFGHIQVFFSGGVRIRISSYSKKIYF